MPNAWLTVDQAAPHLNMSPASIYRAIAANNFPFKFARIGRSIRISAADIGLPVATIENNEARTDQTPTKDSMSIRAVA